MEVEITELEVLETATRLARLQARMERPLAVAALVQLYEGRPVTYPEDLREAEAVGWVERTGASWAIHPDGAQHALEHIKARDSIVGACS